MNRKKVILSILMMVFLIAVGFVLPHLFKEKRGEKPASSAPTKEETTDTEQSSSKTALTFLDFSALQNFFSKGQIETLCQELQTYLTDTGNTSITSVQFLEDKTTYPNASDIGFSFRLSDDSVLPVYYSSSIGRFFYGEERTPGTEEINTYEQQTDENLPVLTTEEIELLPEGGYDDTKETEPEKQPSDHKTTTEAEEVQP